jgi:hypothetical protein
MSGSSPKALNRQAKLKGTDDWSDMGSVSFEDAAVNFAERLGRGADRVHLTLRDADDPVTEFDVTVESTRAYRVIGLRGGM